MAKFREKNTGRVVTTNDADHEARLARMGRYERVDGDATDSPESGLDPRPKSPQDAPGAPEAADAAGELDRPDDSARKAEWVAYAKSKGIDTRGMSVDDLKNATQ